ncbi:hypothetical protein [Streptomyces sp. SID14515]|nr:hypothetical protein [Streptomyces sp. SID14515]
MFGIVRSWLADPTYQRAVALSAFAAVIVVAAVAALNLSAG